MIIFFSRWLGRTFVRFFFPEDGFANIWLLSSCWENLAVLLLEEAVSHGFAVSKISCFERLDVLCLGSLGSKTRKDSKWCTSRLDHATFWMIHSSSSYLLGLSTPHPKNKHISSLSMYNWMLDGYDNLCNPGFFCIRSFSKKMPANSLPVGSIDIWGFQRSGALGQMLETCRLLLKGLRWALRWTDEDGSTCIYIYIYLWGGYPPLNLA